MPLTSDQILSLAVRRNDLGTNGRLEALRRFGLNRNTAIGDVADRRFLAAVQEQPPTSRPDTYVHPMDVARATGPRQDAALTPSDLMWLQRLPDDPTQISHDDAVALAGLVLTQTSNSDPQGNPRPGISVSDRRLLESIWAPLRQLHDRRAAETALTNACRSQPPVPPEASEALTAAIGREVPALTPSEARQRAETKLREAITARDDEHTHEVQRAQQHLDSIATDSASRLAVSA